VPGLGPGRGPTACPPRPYAARPAALPAAPRLASPRLPSRPPKMAPAAPARRPLLGSLRSWRPPGLAWAIPPLILRPNVLCGFAGCGRGELSKDLYMNGLKKPSIVFDSPWALSCKVTAGPCSRHGARVDTAQPAWIASSAPTIDGRCRHLSGIYHFRGSEVTGGPLRVVTQVGWGRPAFGSPTWSHGWSEPLSCNLQPSPPALNSLYRDLHRALEKP